MAPQHLLLVLLINLAWGFNFVVAKVGVSHVPPLLLTGLRFSLVLALLSPFLKFGKPWTWRIFFVAIFAGALHFGLIFTGTKLANASVTAILVQLQLPFATILSMIFLKERIKLRRWIGIALAFGGVMLVGFDPEIFDYRVGALLVAAAALSMATAQVLMRQMKGVSVFEMQARVAALSAPALLLASLFLEHGQLASIVNAPPIVWGVIIYTALAASIFGHGGQYFLLQRYDVALVATMVVLAPIFGIIFGVVLLHDPMSWRIALGGGVALLGVVIIAQRQGRAKPEEPMGDLMPAAALTEGEIGAIEPAPTLKREPS